MATDPTTAVTAASPLDVSGTTNPATLSQRRVSASLKGDQLTGSSVDSSGNQNLFSGAQKSLGKQDFLNLLVTQLRYQDPMQPTENTEFVAQLAQFSNLEGTQNINTSITDLGTKLQSMVSGQAASANTISGASATSLLGKQVRVTASSIAFDPKQGNTVALNVHTDAGTTSVLSILDSTGKLVNAIKIPQTGDVKASWNGAQADGTTAPAGTYTLKVTSTDGATDTGYTYFEDAVTGISYAKDGVKLEVHGQTVGMDQVVHVAEPTAVAAAATAGQ